MLGYHGSRQADSERGLLSPNHFGACGTLSHDAIKEHLIKRQAVFLMPIHCVCRLTQAPTIHGVRSAGSRAAGSKPWTP